MSLTRFAAVTVAASILCCGTADAGGPLRVFKHGLWSGGAYTDDRTGVFSHCSAGVAYDSGINLFVLVTADYRWWLGFINPEWAFKPNVKMPVRLRLDDGGTSLDRQAIIPNGQLMLIPLPDSPRLVDGFRHSSWLALEAEGRSFFFRLREIPAVMDGLTSCVRASLELKDKAPTADLSRGQEKDASANPGSAPAVTQPAASSVAGSPSRRVLHPRARRRKLRRARRRRNPRPPPPPVQRASPSYHKRLSKQPLLQPVRARNQQRSPWRQMPPCQVRRRRRKPRRARRRRNPRPPAHPVHRALPSHRRNQPKQRLSQQQQARNQRPFRRVNWPRRDRDRPLPLHLARKRQLRRIRWMRSTPRLWRRDLRHRPPLQLIPQRQNRPPRRCPPQGRAQMPRVGPAGRQNSVSQTQPLRSRLRLRTGPTLHRKRQTQLPHRRLWPSPR